MPEIPLRAEGLERTYGSGRTAVRAVRGIDLAVEAGERLLIMGPSGSGKTTLLSIVGCLLSADRGTVNILGDDVSSMNSSQLTDFRRQHLAFNDSCLRVSCGQRTKGTNERYCQLRSRGLCVELGASYTVFSGGDSAFIAVKKRQRKRYTSDHTR